MRAEKKDVRVVPVAPERQTCYGLAKRSLEGFTGNEVKVKVLPRTQNRSSSYPNGLEVEEIK